MNKRSISKWRTFCFGKKYAREQKLEAFLRIWGKVITREGITNIPQSVVTT